jgi:hypothetical protein
MMSEKYNARVLDPTDAVSLPDQRVRSTVYIADRLIVPPHQAGSDVVAILDAAARELGMAVYPEQNNLAGVARLVRLVPYAAAGQPQRPVVVDAWAVLQRARGRAGRDPDATRCVA